MSELNLSRLPAQTNPRLLSLQQQYRDMLGQCYQCGKCSASCPLGDAMDLPPQKLLRCLQLGLLDEALHSRGPWLCVACHSCAERCPHQLPLPELMADLRQRAEQAGIRPVRNASVFSRAFLLPVAWFGRSHELTMTILYNFGSGRIWQHFSYLPPMLRGHKLRLWPKLIKNRAAIGRIFKNCAEEARQK